MVKTIRSVDTSFDHLKPVVPAALSDGLLPISSFDPFLVVCAPIIDVPGYVTMPGDLFSAAVNGQTFIETKVEYKGEDSPYVELHIPKDRIDDLEDGIHALSYISQQRPIGERISSGKTLIYLDRSPAGGRYLPRIVFEERIELDGLSLRGLLDLPDAALVGIIPDYAGIDPRDTIHVFMKRRGTNEELAATTISALTDGRPMEVRFDRSILEKINAAGRVDFYYHVVDAASIKSTSSATTPINLSILDSPEQLPPPMVEGADDGLLTDADIRPSLQVRIPALIPQAHAGDTIQLFVGDRAFMPFEIDEDDLDNGPLKTVSLDYATVVSFADGMTDQPFTQQFHYVHRRFGVESTSEAVVHQFDTTLPGGWDPLPATPENEALGLPVLRGATGPVDNVISFEDSTKPASAFIPAPTHVSRAGNGIDEGDRISVELDGTVVAEHVVMDEPYPIIVTIPAKALREHTGLVKMAYEVTRLLSTEPHVAKAKSPSQDVRIHSADALPGAGAALSPSTFIKAREREEEQGYAIRFPDFINGYTQLRIFEYVNMKDGDEITITYNAFDKYDGGKYVPEASGELKHRVTAADLVPKREADPFTGDAIYIDIDFPIEPAKRLNHGHFEYSHVVTNAVGSGASSLKEVIVVLRLPQG
ncbi:hypothetical protein FIV34_09145 [Luteibacter pinisoli]|uniref:Uncharacterized protein n=1 Tax=Luteibacter pinisoli TaxID=2589080 RepID=A0A4Y5Z2Q0_9GAMM|nr:hypothetical protein [Luteibacter pinisoli]QDE39357.1 hypothetical protein FIV34_09145 [Luteibacter pinisoli]